MSKFKDYFLNQGVKSFMNKGESLNIDYFYTIELS
jgi:hypothetical protein